MTCYGKVYPREEWGKAGGKSYRADSKVFIGTSNIIKLLKCSKVSINKHTQTAQ
jgi:hypothetical protein